jgi:hypothetical protein
MMSGTPPSPRMASRPVHASPLGVSTLCTCSSVASSCGSSGTPSTTQRACSPPPRPFPTPSQAMAAAHRKPDFAEDEPASQSRTLPSRLSEGTILSEDQLTRLRQASLRIREDADHEALGDVPRAQPHECSEHGAELFDCSPSSTPLQYRHSPAGWIPPRYARSLSASSPNLGSVAPRPTEPALQVARPVASRPPRASSTGCTRTSVASSWSSSSPPRPYPTPSQASEETRRKAHAGGDDLIGKLLRSSSFNTETTETSQQARVEQPALRSHTLPPRLGEGSVLTDAELAALRQAAMADLAARSNAAAKPEALDFEALGDVPRAQLEERSNPDSQRGSPSTTPSHCRPPPAGFPPGFDARSVSSASTDASPCLSSSGAAVLARARDARPRVTPPQLGATQLSAAAGRGKTLGAALGRSKDAQLIDPFPASNARASAQLWLQELEGEMSVADAWTSSPPYRSLASSCDGARRDPARQSSFERMQERMRRRRLAAKAGAIDR